jgi:hypothetical protein
MAIYACATSIKMHTLRAVARPPSMPRKWLRVISSFDVAVESVLVGREESAVKNVLRSIPLCDAYCSVAFSSPAICSCLCYSKTYHNGMCLLLVCWLINFGEPTSQMNSYSSAAHSSVYLQGYYRSIKSCSILALCLLLIQLQACARAVGSGRCHLFSKQHKQHLIIVL